MLKIITMLIMLLTGTLAQHTENREIPAFSKVKVADGIELVYTEGDQFSLQAKVENPADLQQLITEVKGNTLHIYRMTNSKEPIKVYVTANGTTTFEASSNATIGLTNKATASEIAVILDSGAVFNGELNATEKVTLCAGTGTTFNGRTETDRLTGDFRGDTKINLSGIAASTRISADEKAYCNAQNLVSDNIRVNANDTSTIEIHAKQQISVTVNGMAKVKYTGNPTKTGLSNKALALNTSVIGNEKPIVQFD